MKDGYDVVSGLRTNRADDSIRRFISMTYNKWIIQRNFKLVFSKKKTVYKVSSVKNDAKKIATTLGVKLKI